MRRALRVNNYNRYSNIQVDDEVLFKLFSNMLKRMGMGLFLCVKESVVIVIQVMMTQGEYCNHLYNATIVSCYYLTSKININNACLTVSNFTNNFFHCDQNNTPFLLLLIPNILYGLSYLLVFMTALEFRFPSD